MSSSHFSGPVIALPDTNGGTAFKLGVAVNNAQGATLHHKTTTGIVDSAATTVLTINIPNANQSAVLKVLIRAGITNASHTYDSTRVVEYNIVITRVAGAAAAVAISAAIGAQIATVGSGQTLTCTGSVTAVSGGATATQTCNVQVTNVNVSAGTTDVSVLATLVNMTGGLAVGATTTTGVYLS